MTNAEKLQQLIQDIREKEEELRQFLVDMGLGVNPKFPVGSLVHISKKYLETQKVLNQPYKESK